MITLGRGAYRKRTRNTHTHTHGGKRGRMGDSPLHVLYMSLICPVNVPYMSCICPSYVLYMSLICPLYVHQVLWELQQ